MSSEKLIGGNANAPIHTTKCNASETYHYCGMSKLRKNTNTQEHEHIGTLETVDLETLVGGGGKVGTYHCESAGVGEDGRGQISQAPQSSSRGLRFNLMCATELCRPLERGREGDARVFDEMGCCAAAVSPPQPPPSLCTSRRRSRQRDRGSVSIGDLLHGVRVVFSFPVKMKGTGGE
jgi:hypothetical protein